MLGLPLSVSCIAEVKEQCDFKASEMFFNIQWKTEDVVFVYSSADSNKTLTQRQGYLEEASLPVLQARQHLGPFPAMVHLVETKYFV